MPENLKSILETVLSGSGQITILVAVVIALPEWLGAQQAVKIDLTSSAVDCPHQIIRIQDVANVTSGMSHRRRSKIGQLDLDQFTPHKDRITVTASQIKCRLLIAGFGIDEFQISGHSAVDATHTQSSSIKQQLRQTITRELALQFQIDPDEIKATIDRDPTSDLRSHGLDLNGLTISPQFTTELPIGNHRIETVFEDGRGNAFTANIPVTISVVRELAMAKSNIPRGQLLTRDNMKFVRRPVSNRQVQFASFEQSIGKLARQDIQQFSLIQTGHLERVDARPPPLIRKHDAVTAFSERGKLRVELTGAESLQDGYFGDVIRIRNPRSKQVLRGRVIDSSTVEIVN